MRLYHFLRERAIYFNTWLGYLIVNPVGVRNIPRVQLVAPIVRGRIQPRRSLIFKKPVAFMLQHYCFLIAWKVASEFRRNDYNLHACRNLIKKVLYIKRHFEIL